MAKLANQTKTNTNPPKSNKRFFNGLTSNKNDSFLRNNYLLKGNYTLGKFIMMPSPKTMFLTKLNNTLKALWLKCVKKSVKDLERNERDIFHVFWMI